MKENTIQTLTDNRVKLDFLTKQMNLLPRKRYTSLAITALELGRMYLGEICLDLGKDYPYHKTKEATTAKGIQKAVDLSDKEVAINSNEIVAINEFRNNLDLLIKNSIDTIIEYRNEVLIKDNKERFINDCNISEAYRSLKESRMWLGKRLGEIRDNGK